MIPQTYAAHLYDPQPRHERTPERIPTHVGVPERPEPTSETVDAVLATALVLLPLWMAFAGSVTW